MVHYHTVNYLEKNIIEVNGKSDELKSTYYSESALKSKLESILSTELSQGCLILEGGMNQITLEVLNNTNDYIFARLGNMQDIKTVHLRNKTTWKAYPIRTAI